jgi:hypothetical protein
MKGIFSLSIVSLLSLNCFADISNNIQQNNSSSAITWKPNNGRFGDKLVSYAKAKWLSYKFNIPLLYVPFNYSDQLMLHEQENIYAPESDQLFSHIIHLPNEFNGELIPNNNTLYICYWKIKVDIDWDDNVFMDQLRNNIRPRYTIKKVAIPDGCISVAVHVRNGGGFYFDYDEKRENNPRRFAPEEFFIEQIIRVANMFPNQKLYVHIFTDHQDPVMLKKKFKKALNNPRITFGCREQNNHHNSNVLQDFFSMMDFDCLIRPASNFSKWAEYVGNNKLVITPSRTYKDAQGKSVISAIVIKTRAKVGDIWQINKVFIA